MSASSCKPARLCLARIQSAFEASFVARTSFESGFARRLFEAASWSDDQPNRCGGAARRPWSVRGAREHNLKNVDVDIPRNAFVVFTGVSGSGKSSLAFGTLYAGSQRRFFESVSPYARRLIDQVGGA